MNKEKSPNLLISFLVFLLFLGLAGCGSKDSEQNPPANPSGVISEPNSETPNSEEPEPVEEEPEKTTLTTTLYFPTGDASGLRSVKRDLAFDKEENSLTELIKGIFEELNNPPEGLVEVLPKGTKLHDVTVKDGIATLNLSSAFRDNFPGGATGEQMILYSIVNSLTTLDGVEKVEFLLEGELKAAILGGLDTSVPVSPNQSIVLD